ncbi:MAG: histidinol dehydrogenase, partial [Gemmataceae bacterium]
EIYRIGGAQAVAALAYGIDGLAAVDMIVGPGNLFVALAKRHVYGQVAIDCIAGPSEVVVLADDTARPEFLAADLLAQAEHSPGCSIMVTWHAPLLDAVAAELDRQLAQLSRAEWTRDALAQFGAFVLTRNQAEAVAVVNQLAPEHLEICTADPEGIVAQIDHAGAIFLGPYSPVAVGDYAAGPSHVLPTGATARFASGLSANEFLRRSSVIRFDREGLARLAADVERLAKLEGLTAHAASVTCRFGKGGET